MKCLIFITVFILAFSSLYAQRTMVVEKIGTSRRFFFREGDYCKIRSARPDTLLAGKIWSIGDSSVFVAGLRPYEINLRDITSVYKKFAFPVKFAKYMAIGGLGIFGIITVNHLLNNEQVFTPDMFIISGAMLGLGAISYSLGEKRCRTDKRWKVKILEMQVR